MIHFSVPTSKEDLLALASHHDAANFFNTQSDDPDVVRQSNATLSAIEAAFDAATCTLDESGNLIQKSSLGVAPAATLEN